MKAFIIILLLLPMVFADSDINSKIDQASDIIQDFFYGIDNKDMVIIQGSKVTFEEKMIFSLIKQQNAQLQGIDVTNDGFKGKREAYILIGQKTNKHYQTLNIKESTTEIFSPIVLNYGTLDTGEKFLVAYSEREDKNKQNQAILKSPLARFIDPKYIPYVVISTSILLLYLWNMFGNTVANLVSDFVSSKILKRKTRKRKIMKGEFLRYTEIIAFVVTVLLFSLEMSWSWSEDAGEFVELLMLNIVVVGVILFSRELVRLIYCHRNKLRSEYVLWPMGSIFTVISTYLGNTFALASYTMLDEDKADAKKFGKAAFLINLYTYIIAFVAYIVNIIIPSVFLQMSFVYCIMILFLEMFWLSPMPGAEIRRWNKWAWLIFYIVIIASYIYTNFTVYAINV